MKQVRTKFKNTVLVDNVYESPVEIYLSRRRRLLFWIGLAVVVVIVVLVIVF